MKIKAGILLSIWSILMLQPGFTYFGGKPAYGSCSKVVATKPSCSKSKPTCSMKKTASSPCSKKKCSKNSESGNKGSCGNEGCNPSLGCSSGNFYVQSYYQITLTVFTSQIQKLFVKNDDRLVKSLSECWHPPEA